MLLVTSFSLSFFFLSIARKTLPRETAYAVWTGIGAAGAALAGIMLYNEPRNPSRILAILMVLGSVIGLKLIA
ncbi:MAG: SMR family transporter [Selenomonadaceae bacterium]